MSLDENVEKLSPKNTSLVGARKEKNDEFYTKLSDIENELKHYRAHFKNKSVFCNCDDPEWSNFYKFFTMNFEFLELKKLTTTHYEKGGSSYKLEYFGAGQPTIKTNLNGDGDFRSEEAIEILKECDVVVTNPPFSLFREFITLLASYNKKFLVIGNSNSVAYKDVFKLIRSDELWLGRYSVKEFLQPDGSVKKFGNICWFTNLHHSKRNVELIPWKNYSGNELDYPQYDNYDAIEVGKVADIPGDFSGYMGVPITFLDKYNPEQFSIIGLAAGNIRGLAGIPTLTGKDGPYIGGKLKYCRLIIKRKIKY